MSQWLRALAALPEVLNSIPSNHMVAHKSPILGSDALLWSKGVLTDRALIYIKHTKLEAEVQGHFCSPKQGL